MKAKNLRILKENGINVPNFITVNGENEIDMSFSNSEFFAVRSSYCLEDDDNNSFAGQFKTILNVKRDEIKNAVLDVIKSYDQKKLYKGISANSLSKSPVIIQEMIYPDISGVIFTANPLGILNESVITAGYGLGENVVEDKTETVTYYYNKDESLFYLKEKSNISVDPKILNELTDIALKIKNIFKKESDIEFAVKNGVIYILQARPVTSLNTENPIILDNSNIVESYPGITMPLTQDFVHNAYKDIFGSCISRFVKNKNLLKAADEITENMVTDYHGGIYYVINNWYEILHLLPFSNKIIKIWQEMLGVENKSVSKSRLKVSKVLKLKISISFLYYLMITPRLMKKLNKYFDDIYPKYKEKIKGTNTVEELLELFHKTEKSVTDVWDITLINDIYTFIFTALSGGKKNEKIASINNLESMKPVNAMNELRVTAHKEGIDSDTYRLKENEYIELFGDRIYGELKLETKTYRTNPELLRQQILSSEIPTKCEHENTGRVLNPFIRAAKRGISNREKSRLNRSRLFGLAREIMLKTGELLKRNGQLDEKEDIFFLYQNEINSLDRYQELISERKKRFDMYRASPPPRRIVFGNGIIDNQRITCEKQFEGSTVLHGTQTSLGKAVGKAAVIFDPNMDTDVTDKIIITKSTDPGWVFLIEKCKGIVAERGSVLSHTAIISRELKKPAVVNVKDAAKIIKTGDLIEIDADSGTVKILKRID